MTELHVLLDDVEHAVRNSDGLRMLQRGDVHRNPYLYVGSRGVAYGIRNAKAECGRGRRARTHIEIDDASSSLVSAKLGEGGILFKFV